MPLHITNHVIGHRGASAYAPENTMAAFDKALSLGCTAIEFDVMLNADGMLFVFHDENIKRTTNGRGEFGRLSTDYLTSLDAGKWFSRRFIGEKIPTFSEVLQWLNFCNITANIEIKPYPGLISETTTAVLAEINRYWPNTKELPLISSFELEALQLCRSLAPEMPLGLLLDTWDAQWEKKAQELQCYSVHFNRRALNEQRVKEIKDQGYQLFVYTVNRKRQAQKLLAWGVDAVFSDYPDLCS